MLELLNFKKRYNTKLVLDIPVLKIENGIYWLKGENGSGKTTLLKIVAGLLPFEGDVKFNNISIKKDPVVYRQKIGWAEAEPLFPFFMTGIDIITLYKGVRHATQKEIDLLLSLFNMNDFISNTIATYSAGMTKKLSLVLALLGNPLLVLLDEPLITLDEQAFDLVCNFIVEKNKSAGTFFIMSSHHDLDVESVSGKQLRLVDNTIVT